MRLTQARVASHPAPSALLAAALLLCASCASGPPPASLESWHDAVIAAQAQSDVVFRGVNQLAREAQVERAAQLENLRESDFEPALDPRSLAVWHGTFDDLAGYAQALEKLVDPGTSAGVGSSLTRLSDKMAAQANASIFQERPGLASAIGKLGAAIAGAAARSEAQAIMRETDSDVTALLGEMSKMIADQESDEEIGVVAVVRATWTDKANGKRTEFLGASSAESKKRVAREYADLLEKRSAADGLLRDLKRSLESLAASHTAMAQGGANDLGSLIARLREQTALAQSIVDDLQRTEP